MRNLFSAAVLSALYFTIVPGSVLAQGASTHAFGPIAEVLRHPRCMNCHTVTNFPRQTDQRLRHAQLVVRGKDGHGAPTLQCNACHQDRNVADGKVPGAPHWHLAPLSMGWENLDDTQLCEALLDRSKNGNRSVSDLVHHMTVDALVLWGWSPGGDRTLPPYPHAEFVSYLEDWADAGAPCP
ncbi:hypothetical protein [Litorivivens sp.]|uniref:hypothetical protein n=1 Tax=Litorivivens sp. TaxID=2020868 RepID=UPI0035676F2F